MEQGSSLSARIQVDWLEKSCRMRFEMKFRIWNYGLFGDENTWDISGISIGEFGIVLIELETWKDFVAFYKKYEVVGIEIGTGNGGNGTGYVASLQLPTTYSTCGAMGYPDPVETTSNFGQVKNLYENCNQSHLLTNFDVMQSRRTRRKIL